MSEVVVLIVEDDASIRRLLRTGLELEGYTVMEAASLEQARAVTDPVDAIVLDRELPDGDGLHQFEELRSRHGAGRVVIHSNLDVPDAYPSAPKGDVDAVLAALDLQPATASLTNASDLTRHVASEVVAKWSELCTWDPELPPDNQPRLATSVVRAVAAALERPQPLGWGVDPAIEPLAEAFVLNATNLDVAVTQLVSLREAFERCVVDRLPESRRLETARRLTMIAQRLTTIVVRAGVHDLATQAFTDPLTGLLNRRAFEADLRRETSRARRHGRPLTIVAMDVDSLKEVNDRFGHSRGDELLRHLGQVLTASCRTEDSAYRIGGDEFVVLLPDTVAASAEILSRLHEQGAPACSVGTATYPSDPLDQLLELADRRLYERRSIGRRRAVETRHLDADGAARAWHDATDPASREVERQDVRRGPLQLLPTAPAPQPEPPHTPPSA